jgi:hypothetical protein
MNDTTEKLSATVTIGSGVAPVLSAEADMTMTGCLGNATAENMNNAASAYHSGEPGNILLASGDVTFAVDSGRAAAERAVGADAATVKATVSSVPDEGVVLENIASVIRGSSVCPSQACRDQCGQLELRSIARRARVRDHSTHARLDLGGVHCSTGASACAVASGSLLKRRRSASVSGETNSSKDTMSKMRCTGNAAKALQRSMLQMRRAHKIPRSALMSMTRVEKKIFR